MNDRAPLILFVYNRLDSLKENLLNLAKCNLANETELFVFSDGSKGDMDEDKVRQVRKYLRELKGFKKIHITESPTNIGLAPSIISGVTEIINQYGKVIVLEDDLLVSENFLDFMNAALNFYTHNKKIFSISGYSPVIEGIDKNYDVYFTKRSSSWGWATWKNRWELVDWSVSYYDVFLNDSKARKDFNKMGSDMTRMLKKQMRGEINSWAIRWCYSQFRLNLFTVFPRKSKVVNIGFGSDSATHTKDKNDRFYTALDVSNSKSFGFDPVVKLNNKIIRQFVKPYSLRYRLFNKIINNNILDTTIYLFKIF